jgi:ornithine decarboxylase
MNLSVPVETHSAGTTPRSIIQSKVATLGALSQDPFFIVDLGVVKRKHQQFQKLLPRVQPFYAIKCNPDDAVIELLAQLGAGFDCASRAEIEQVRSYNVAPENIIYANPCKQPSMIKYAAEENVAMMTFDNLDEISKIKSIYPTAKLVLRILADDPNATSRLGLKFGAHEETVPMLLARARSLNADIVGVSFHVGSGCSDASVYGMAVEAARRTFDLARDYGFNMNLLDIGGGFPGLDTGRITFPQIAEVVETALSKHFPEVAFPNLRVIAEPGRFYVQASHTLSVAVTSKRAVTFPCVRDASDYSTSDSSGDESLSPSSPSSGAPGRPGFMYYINDGIYGSFNCIIFDHQHCHPTLLFPPTDVSKNEIFPCSIWGPTCDCIDIINKNARLPELDVGDWLVFDHMGAYTRCAASNFNGFAKPHIYYVNIEQE